PLEGSTEIFRGGMFRRGRWSAEHGPVSFFLSLFAGGCLGVDRLRGAGEPVVEGDGLELRRDRSPVYLPSAQRSFRRVFHVAAKLLARAAPQGPVHSFARGCDRAAATNVAR